MGTIYDPLIKSMTIIDRSIPANEPQTVSPDSSLGGIFPVFCSKGKDNVIIEERNAGTLMSQFGDDFNSFTKYGQANLTALGLVRSQGRSFVCRLLPEDAKRAYIVFGVYVKILEEIPQYERMDTVYNGDKSAVIAWGSGTFKLDNQGQKIPAVINFEPAVAPGAQLRLGRLELEAGQFDEKGYPTLYNGEPQEIADETFYPLFAFSYYGRGSGGNSYGFNILRNVNRDRVATDGRRYYLNCYEQLSNGAYSSILAEPLYFTFNPDATYSADSTVQEGLSKIYQNIDLATGEEVKLQFYPYDASIVELMNALAPYRDPSESVFDIDIINCIFKNGNPYGRIIKAQDTLNPSTSTIMLANGNEGSLDPNSHTPEEIAATREGLLIRFCKYEIDDSLLDEKIVDADIFPDENFPIAVKRSILTDFHPYRPDIKPIMDVGITQNYRDAINNLNELTPYVLTDYAFMVSINGHSGTLNDPSIGSPHPVTYTYDYVRSMADNFSYNGGAFQMHAGANRGQVKYFRPYWIAKKSLNNMYDTLADVGLNYIERLNKRGDLVYGLESTQYMLGGNSKLQSDRNSLVIGRAMRLCHQVLAYYTYDERSIDATLTAAQIDLSNNLRGSNIPTTIGVNTTLYQTSEDKKEENAHCDIAFTFPDYAKSFHVTIYALRPGSELPPSMQQ
jgi:hypothetical protein